jgi:hypothetical protein
MGIDQKDAQHTGPAITTVRGRFYLSACRWCLLGDSVDWFIVGRVILGRRLLQKVSRRVFGAVARWRRCYRLTRVIILLQLHF